MATAEQIKALIRSHMSEDQERFITLALQVAAHEAKQGHGALALEIRDLIDQSRAAKRKSNQTILPPDLENLVYAELPGTPFSALVLPPELLGRLTRVLFEYRQRDKLYAHSLKPRRKLLLTGPPGCGKTLTARVLAHELRQPLFTVQVDRLVTKFMGETSSRLRLMFDLVRERDGVYLFDEFDALGGGRTRENDVGEMRRVLTALLQFIEEDDSNSLIIAATNTPELLDRALFRRFDDILSYGLPDDAQRRKLVANTMGSFIPARYGWKQVIDASEGLSCADIVMASRDAMKEAVLADQTMVAATRLISAILERRQSVDEPQASG